MGACRTMAIARTTTTACRTIRIGVLYERSTQIVLSILSLHLLSASPKRVKSLKDAMIETSLSQPYANRNQLG